MGAAGHRQSLDGLVDTASLLVAVKTRASQAGVFGSISIQPGRLVCTAKNSAHPAEYRIEQDGRQLWVALMTPHRYLSQSIEQDLVVSGDRISELLSDELIDLDDTVPAEGLAVEHFRSPDKLFTFRTPLPVDLSSTGQAEAERAAAVYLLAYEACFRPLGDMDAGAEQKD